MLKSACLLTGITEHTTAGELASISELATGSTLLSEAPIPKLDSLTCTKILSGYCAVHCEASVVGRSPHESEELGDLKPYPRYHTGEHLQAGETLQ